MMMIEKTKIWNNAWRANSLFCKPVYRCHKLENSISSRNGILYILIFILLAEMITSVGGNDEYYNLSLMITNHDGKIINELGARFMICWCINENRQWQSCMAFMLWSICSRRIDQSSELCFLCQSKSIGKIGKQECENCRQIMWPCGGHHLWHRWIPFMNWSWKKNHPFRCSFEA